MRLPRTSFLLLSLLAAPAIAQDVAPETIEVIGTHSLAGFWKISFPSGIPISIPLVIRGTMGGNEAFCRMEEAKTAMTVRCLPWNGDGTATVDAKSLHLAWGVAVFRFVIDAPILTATAFMGTYRLKVMGDSHDAPTPASGRKLAPSADTPDVPGQGPTLLARLKDIAAGAVPDDATRKSFGMRFGGPPATTAAALQGLGPPVQAIYLGASTPPEIPPPPPGARPDDRNDARLSFFRTGFSVYDVEFAGGQQRLCGVHPGEDGKVNVLCV